MSATALSVSPTASRSPRRTLVRPRGLVWTVLRLHRAALWTWLAFVVVTAGLLLWLYGPGATAAQQEFDRYGYYVPNGWSSAKNAYDLLFYRPAGFIRVATFAVPLFAASALVGRELESGTAPLAWTQSVSPARWLAVKLAVPAVAIAAGTGLLVVLYRLLWTAHNGLLYAGHAPQELYFRIGPATVAYPLLGLAVGALAGLLVGRALPALAVAVAVQYVITSLHDHLWPFQHLALFTSFPELAVRGGAHRTYLPSPEYWPRQLLETGVVLALTALVVAVSLRVLHKKVAAA
ncbi:hypothetical protein [Streptomyces sp. NPDC001315]|uniref:hypothetical protein n=1 Tax=Streptomyces sp. NPDC001315 TaxID=3364562 RepID=UPI0036CC7EFD